MLLQEAVCYPAPLANELVQVVAGEAVEEETAWERSSMPALQDRRSEQPHKGKVVCSIKPCTKELHTATAPQLLCLKMQQVLYVAAHEQDSPTFIYLTVTKLFISAC